MAEVGEPLERGWGQVDVVPLASWAFIDDFDSNRFALVYMKEAREQRNGCRNGMETYRLR